MSNKVDAQMERMKKVLEHAKIAKIDVAKTVDDKAIAMSCTNPQCNKVEMFSLGRTEAEDEALFVGLEKFLNDHVSH